jgi:hypothetical protein
MTAAVGLAWTEASASSSGSPQGRSESPDNRIDARRFSGTTAPFCTVASSRLLLPSFRFAVDHEPGERAASIAGRIAFACNAKAL